MGQSNAWKGLERKIAKSLGGVRVLRGSDFSVGGVDVTVEDFPELKIDAKYKTAGWKHHTYLAEVQKKYCGEDDVALLVTKNKGETGECVTLSLDDFADLLDMIRLLRADNRQAAQVPESITSAIGDGAIWLAEQAR